MENHTPLCIQFDEEILVGNHINHEIYVRDLQTMELRGTIKGHTSWVKCLQFDENSLISGSYDATLREHRRMGGGEWEFVKEYKGHGGGAAGRPSERAPDGSVVCMQFDEDKIISGSTDTTMRIWNRQSGACSAILRGHTKTVRCLAYNTYNTLCSGGSDRVIRVHDLAMARETRQLRLHAHRISCIQLCNTNPNLLVSGSNDKGWLCGICVRPASLWDASVYTKRLYVAYNLIR